MNSLVVSYMCTIHTTKEFNRLFSSIILWTIDNAFKTQPERRSLRKTNSRIEDCQTISFVYPNHIPQSSNGSNYKHYIANSLFCAYINEPTNMHNNRGYIFMNVLRVASIYFINVCVKLTF